jgi:hypothetical protein
MNAKTIATGLVAAAFALLVTEQAHAQGFQTVKRQWTFNDAPNSGWFFGGNAGYDIDRGWGFEGYPNNVWANNWPTGVWNSVNVEFVPGVGAWGGAETTCTVTAEVETSSNFVNGLVAVWDVKDGMGGPLGAQLGGGSFGAYGNWTEITYDFNVSKSSGTVLLDFGFWGTGTPQWMRIADVTATCWNFN